MGNILGYIAVLSVVIAIAYGWVLNLITLLQSGYETIAQMIVGVIGILIAPVGALTYYIAG